VGTQIVRRFFELDAQRNTSPGKRAAPSRRSSLWILFAYPGILSAAGVPFEGAVAATAAATAICSILNGAVPIAQHWDWLRFIRSSDHPLHALPRRADVGSRGEQTANRTRPHPILIAPART
jgi:hypothetical protein